MYYVNDLCIMLMIYVLIGNKQNLLNKKHFLSLRPFLSGWGNLMVHYLLRLTS